MKLRRSCALQSRNADCSSSSSPFLGAGIASTFKTYNPHTHPSVMIVAYSRMPSCTSLSPILPALLITRWSQHMDIMQPPAGQAPRMAAMVARRDMYRRLQVQSSMHVHHMQIKQPPSKWALSAAFKSGPWGSCAKIDFSVLIGQDHASREHPPQETIGCDPEFCIACFARARRIELTQVIACGT